MINENTFELSDEQLAEVAGGSTNTRLTQIARGALTQSNRASGNTTATLNAGNSKGNNTFEVAGATFGFGNIGVVSVSNG
jgi:hypothetical protein